MISPLGLPARITIYKDADHAHDLLTRRSVTGILLMVNNTPVKWISKRQKTIETSTYGSEMVAGQIATELVVEYRNTLRLLGVPIDGPALMLGDNQSIVLSTTVPSSILKKKAQCDCLSSHLRSDCSRNHPVRTYRHRRKLCGYINKTIAWTGIPSIGKATTIPERN